MVWNEVRAPDCKLLAEISARGCNLQAPSGGSGARQGMSRAAEIRRTIGAKGQNLRQR